MPWWSSGKGIWRIRRNNAPAVGLYDVLPSAGADFRGALGSTWGGAGVADSVVVCLKDAADAYSWEDLLATGGGGGGTTIIVQEGDANVDTAVGTLDFDASDFNVTSSPAGEANIALAYGTGAGTPAEGNHAHANDHVAATVSDTASLDLSIAGQAISGVVINDGHTHATQYQPLDSDLTTIAGLTATTDNFMVATASAWASRTPTQAIAQLGLDADLATFALPASTTISAFGASLIDDAAASNAIATLGLDADLATFALPASTTISAFGASLIDDASAAVAIATLGLDADIATLALPASTTISAFGATLVDDASATAAIATLGLDADIATLSLPASTTITAAAATVLDDATVGDMLTTLGGQPLDADLTTIAGLTATTDNMIQSVASAWASRTPTQVKTALGLVIGTNVQAWDADLDTLAGLTATTNNFIVSNASAWASRTPTQALVHLGLDADLPTFSVPASTTISTFGASLIDDTTEAAARDTLGLIAGDAGDIWVEKAGDTMTGDLFITKADPALRITNTDLASAELQIGMNTGNNAALFQTLTVNKDFMFYNGQTALRLAATGGVATFSGNIVVNGVASQTNVLNESGVDQDTRMEGDTATNLFVLDASADSIEIGTTTQGDIAKFATGSIIFNESGADRDTRFEGDTDANLLYLDAGADSVAIGGSAPTSWFDLKAGTTLRASVRIPTATNLLTTPLSGAVEYDGASYYATAEATPGRPAVDAHTVYRLTGDSGALTSGAIADYFPASSSVTLAASAIYEVTCHCYFTKTTAGTLIWTFLASSAPTAMSIGVASGDATGSGGTSAAATTVATVASASLTTAVKHYALVKGIVETNAAANIRLRVTPSAGTVTPLRGSWYAVRRLPAGNTGLFAT